MKIVAAHLLLVVSVVVALVISRCTSQTDNCRYTYTQQPLQNLKCNPYINGRLIIDCEVTYGRTEQAVTLQWVLRRNNFAAVVLVDQRDDRYTITPGIGTSLTRSQIRIDSLTDSDSGSYFCQIRFTNGTLAVRSQEMDLFSQSIFQAAQIVSSCSGFVGQSERKSTCAIRESVGGGVTNGGNDGGGNPVTNGGNGDGGDSGLGTGDITIYALVAGVVVFIVVVILLIVAVIFGNIWCNRNC